MRDINRICPFMAELEALWKQYPDMRFCQLMACVFGDNMPFYLEDEHALTLIKEGLY
jgi:hypothetical protein